MNDEFDAVVVVGGERTEITRYIDRRGRSYVNIYNGHGEGIIIPSEVWERIVTHYQCYLHFGSSL